MKRYFLVASFLISACTSPNNDQQQVKLFLENWSRDLASGNEQALRNYYDFQFALPKVLFNRPQGISFELDIENAQINPSENEGIINITIPFNISSADGSYTDQGNFSMDIEKSELGNFLITQMTQELAIKIKHHGFRQELQTNQLESTLNDSILQAAVDTLSQVYDRVVYAANVDGIQLFYVVTGNWEDPYDYENQRDKGDYKIGVVTSENKIIIPVEFDKIYNPNGSFVGFIEVEKDGKRGLYQVAGGAFVAADYDAIYPVSVSGVFAQVKKEERYGWVSNEGAVSFEPDSHKDQRLFQSPVMNKSIEDWAFNFPGQIVVLQNLTPEEEGYGLIVYPSYLRDVGATPIANGSVMLASSEYGMGTDHLEMKFEKVQSITDKLFALVAFFMETGADARGYQTSRNDLVVLNQDAETVSNLQGLTNDGGGQNPCEVTWEYKSMEPGFYEAKDNMGTYNYYKVNSDGQIEKQETVRQYTFTKFTNIDEQYFSDCRYDNLGYDGGGGPNLVVIRGLSSEDLDIMRNEIYAEYGFIFKSQKWKDYFQSKSWYAPQYDNVDKFLSETDKYNIKFIQEYQRNHKNLEAERDSIQFMWAG